MAEKMRRRHADLQWPYKLRDVPCHAPYLSGAELTIAADCTAYAYGGFREAVGISDVLLIGCARDGEEQTKKLSEMISENGIRSITLLRMEVGCCDGLEQSVKKAIELSGREISYSKKVISTDGKILGDT